MLSLLGNDSVNAFQHATVGSPLLWRMLRFVASQLRCNTSLQEWKRFSVWSVSKFYKTLMLHESNLTRVEAGSNTSTVTLRVVGGDKKGSLKYETVKYDHENKGTRTQEALRWRGPVACTKDRPVISSERALNKSRTVIVKK
jgi:hypothetical protein